MAKKKTTAPTVASVATPPDTTEPASIVDTHLAGRQQELDELVEHINLASQKSLDGLELIAKTCARATELLPADNPLLTDEFVRRLPFEPSKFSKFVQIGKNEFMWSNEVKPHLPQTSFTTLYVVARMGGKWEPHVYGRIEKIKQTLRNAIADGVLNPKATREELSAFVASGRQGGGNKTDKDFVPVANVAAPLDMEDGDYESLEADLRRLQQRYGAKVVLNRDKIVKTVKECQDKRAEFLSDKINTAIKMELSKIGDTPERKKREKQLLVSHTTPLPTMQANLVAIGMPTLFDILKDDAEKKHPLPPTVLAWTTGRWKDHPALQVERGMTANQ